MIDLSAKTSSEQYFNRMRSSLIIHVYENYIEMRVGIHMGQRLLWVIYKSIKKIPYLILETGPKFPKFTYLCMYIYKCIHNFSSKFDVFCSLNLLKQGLQAVFHWISSNSCSFQIILDCSKTDAWESSCTSCRLAAVVSSSLCCTLHL